MTFISSQHLQEIVCTTATLSSGAPFTISAQTRGALPDVNIRIATTPILASVIILHRSP
jgi:hypothetical protein